MLLLVAWQLATAVTGYFSPSQFPPPLDIVTALGGVQKGGWGITAGFTAVVAVVAALAALTARETKDVPTAELGQKRRYVGGAPSALPASAPVSAPVSTGSLRESRLSGIGYVRGHGRP